MSRDIFHLSGLECGQVQLSRNGELLPSSDDFPSVADLVPALPATRSAEREDGVNGATLCSAATLSDWCSEHGTHLDGPFSACDAVEQMGPVVPSLHRPATTTCTEENCSTPCKPQQPAYITVPECTPMQGAPRASHTIVDFPRRPIKSRHGGLGNTDDFQGAGMSSPRVRSSTCGKDPFELKAFGSPFQASHSSPIPLSPPVELFGVPARHASAAHPGAIRALTSSLSDLSTSSRLQDYRFSNDRRAYTSKGVPSWERSGQEAGDVEPRSRGSSPRSPPWGQPRRRSDEELSAVCCSGVDMQRSRQERDRVPDDEFRALSLVSGEFGSTAGPGHRLL